MKRIIIPLLALVFSVCAAAQSKHYSGEVSVGGVSGLNGYYSGIDFQTVHGANVGKGSFVGIGAGLIFGEVDETSIPLFVQYRQSFTTGEFKPYLALSAGMTINLEAGYTPYLSPEFGVKYNRVGLFARAMIGNTRNQFIISLPETMVANFGGSRYPLSAGISYSFGKK